MRVSSPTSKRPKTSNVQSPNVQSPKVHSHIGDPIETHPNIGLLPLSSCGDIDGSCIINGRTPKLYELPWMTLISYSTSRGLEFRCGGSVINSKYILTAAHCVTDGTKFKNIAGVRIGEFDYGTNNSAPICLPVYSDLRNTRLAGKNATIAGWGTTEKDIASTKLVKAEVPILASDICSYFYNRYVHQRNLLIKNSFCAGDMIKDSCSGDSGGPLIVESDFNNQVRLVQYGIVSFGPRTCGSQFPDFYTDVSKYMHWILDKIRA